MTEVQEQLTRALGRLRATHDATWEQLARECDYGFYAPGAQPENVKDTSGRPVLADMQIALVNGYAALVAAEANS